MLEDIFKIDEKKFNSRLMLGTGKYKSPNETIEALKSSKTEIVTIAIRRLDLKNPSKETELDFIDWSKYTVLPNTAGCKNIEEAIYTANMGRELTRSNWVKLEVISDKKYLLPDPIQTFKAAKILIKEGFVVFPYIYPDPILAKRLEEIGCATVMPLGSAIGSGQGIMTKNEIKIIIENAKIPVIVDAGLGVPSDASIAMELGASAVLVNTAIAKASNTKSMAQAFSKGVEAGREAYLSGRMRKQEFASASSPVPGTAFQHLNG